MIKIENLNKDEKILMIEFLPMNEVVKFLKLKKNVMKFAKELAGTRIDEKSSLLQKKLPKMFSYAIDSGDKITINFIQMCLYNKLLKINEHLEANIGSVEVIKNIIQNKKKENYMELIKIFEEKEDLKYILLVLKLNEIELKVRQKSLLNNSIEEFNYYKKVKSQVEKIQKEKFDIEYNKKIQLIEEKGQTLLKNQESIIKDLRCKILEKDKIIQEKNKEIKFKIKELNEEQKKYKKLEKKIELANEEVKKIKEVAKDNKVNYDLYIEREINRNKELEKTIEDQTIIINRLENDIEERYEQYSEKYLVRFQEEYDEFIQEKITLMKEVEDLNIEFNLLKSEISDLEQRKEISKKKLEEYDKLVNDFIENIDKEIVLSKLKSSILNVPQSNIQMETRKEKLYIRNSFKGDEILEISSIDEWSEILDHNLKSIGVRKDRDSWSYYILSVLASKMIPLIVGYKTRDIANCISSSYAGETPFIISLPSSYSDLNELIDIYHNCSSKVILIEGVIGQMNESLLLPLLKEYTESKETDKIIIMSCEDTNMVDLIPSYLFEYIAPIEIKDIRPVIQSNYINANNMDTLRKFKNSQLDINFSYKKLSRLFKNINNFNSYIFTRTLILGYLCEQMEYDNALVCLGICDLQFVIKDENIKEKIENNIENYENDFCEDFKTLIVGE